MPAGRNANASLKAFLFVGIAYFLVAVVAPHSDAEGARRELELRGRGHDVALIAGIVGAIGAFTLILASVRLRLQRSREAAALVRRRGGGHDDRLRRRADRECDRRAARCIRRRAG